MKKALILALIAGLMVGSAVAADAKKKKAKPITLKYFLHYPTDSAGNCGSTFMDLEDSADSGCGYVAQPANEVLYQGGSALANDWPASGGFPFKLNAKKPVTAEFQLMNFVGTEAQGHAIFELDVTATIGGKSVTLIDETKELTMAAPGSNVATFKVKLSKKLNKDKVTALYANTVVRGASNFHYFELDNNGANVTIPGLK
jgi:hypothetical protein